MLLKTKYKKTENIPDLYLSWMIVICAGVSVHSRCAWWRPLRWYYADAWFTNVRNPTGRVIDFRFVSALFSLISWCSYGKLVVVHAQWHMLYKGTYLSQTACPQKPAVWGLPEVDTLHCKINYNLCFGKHPHAWFACLSFRDSQLTGTWQANYLQMLLS